MSSLLRHVATKTRVTSSTRTRGLVGPKGKRCFNDYFWDVVRARSLSPTNPIWEDINTDKSESTEDKGTKEVKETPSLAAKPLRFSQWRSHHMGEAWDKYPKHHQEDVQAFFTNLQAIQTNKKKIVTDHALLKQILEDWDALISPLHTLHNSTYLLSILSETFPQQQQWRETLQKVQESPQFPLLLLPQPGPPSPSNNNPMEQALELLYSTLDKLVKNEKGVEPNVEVQVAARYLKQRIHQQTGVGVPTGQESKEQYRSTLQSLQSAHGRILSATSPLFLQTQKSLPEQPTTTHPFLSDAHGVIQLQHANANLMGFDNYVDYVMKNDNHPRMVSDPTTVRDLNIAVSDLLQPMAEQAVYRYDDGPNGVPVSPTLDGTLQAMFQLVDNLFGIGIKEDTTAETRTNSLWYRDCRIFHVYESSQQQDEDSEGRLLGTIILDPFRRAGKANKEFCVPLRHRSKASSPTGNIDDNDGVACEPVVAVCLTIAPPVWQEDCAAMQWKDAESLFHEFGHAIQLLLGGGGQSTNTNGNSSGGLLVGAQNLPLDVSEIVPKFMELCLFEESCLESVIDLSNQTNKKVDASSAMGLTPDMIESIHEWRLQRKALQSIQHSFLGTLELDLFDGSIVEKKPDSLISLQRQLAAQFVPHDMPLKDDLSPTLQIMQENAAGYPIGMYRYLWADVISADLFRQLVVGDDGSSPEANLCGSDDSDSQKILSKRGRVLRESLLDPGATVDTEKLLGEYQKRYTGLQTLLMDVYSK